MGVGKAARDGYVDVSAAEAGTAGFVEVAVSGDGLYGLRMTGDGLAPVIEHGHILVLSTLAEPENGQRVLVGLRDGRMALRKLLYRAADGIVVRSLLGGADETIEQAQIERVHGMVAMCEPSQWRNETPAQRGDVIDDRPVHFGTDPGDSHLGGLVDLSVPDGDRVVLVEAKRNARGSKR